MKKPLSGVRVRKTAKEIIAMDIMSQTGGIVNMLQAKEVWLPVAGYEGVYEVSNVGNVRRTGADMPLKMHVANMGYYTVSLSKGGKIDPRLVHRLVAAAFVHNPSGFPVVDHLDGNKLNNKAENLEWCTSAENTRRAWRMGLVPQPEPMYGEDNPLHVLTAEKAREIRRLYAGGECSQRQLAKMFGVSQTTIKSIVKNRTWKEA